MKQSRICARVALLGEVLETHRELCGLQTEAIANLDHMFAEATAVRDEFESLLTPLMRDVEIVDAIERLELRLEMIEAAMNDGFERMRSTREHMRS